MLITLVENLCCDAKCSNLLDVVNPWCFKTSLEISYRVTVLGRTEAGNVKGFRLRGLSLFCVCVVAEALAWRGKGTVGLCCMISHTHSRGLWTRFRDFALHS